MKLKHTDAAGLVFCASRRFGTCFHVACGTAMLKPSTTWAALTGDCVAAAASLVSLHIVE
jgi:hypothetical protein